MFKNKEKKRPIYKWAALKTGLVFTTKIHKTFPLHIGDRKVFDIQIVFFDILRFVLLGRKEENGFSSLRKRNGAVLFIYLNIPLRGWNNGEV